jgi:hypothetical protein
MDVDFSIELTREDPVLDFPWTDPSGNFAYVDLKRHPDLLATIPEAEAFPDLRDFLRSVNSSRTAVETAKCDAWATAEFSAEEEIYNAAHKFASYVDVVFSGTDARVSMPRHEEFAKNLVALLRRAPETPASVEISVRRCYFAADDGGPVWEGFYFTLYVSGYGDDEDGALRNWGVALKLVGNAMIQLSRAG